MKYEVTEILPSTQDWHQIQRAAALKRSHIVNRSNSYGGGEYLNIIWYLRGVLEANKPVSEWDTGE
ncbi:hypothetical protein BC936DRAFT_137564 [Jimgerdemannia flammicorona]|uniref:Uncharacterized protein n=1 Tax=Jimgerdemannia flammicorona TaxID=994334 RepID=A0A433CX19_9FUNG|nr:hypothetical protein BC936DRAFT_137564 [Jimgerdemannia flammicorona]